MPDEPVPTTAPPDPPAARRIPRPEDAAPHPFTATPRGWFGIGPVSNQRLALAMLVAAASDALSIPLAPFEPLILVLDVITALLLFVILGWQWPLLPALISEAVPLLSLFPAWVLVVAGIGMGRPANSPPPQK